MRWQITHATRGETATADAGRPTASSKRGRSLPAWERPHREQNQKLRVLNCLAFAVLISTLMTAAELGVFTPDEVQQNVTTSSQITDAGQLATLTIYARRLQQLTALYRKSMSEGYKTGQISDADYVPHLEAIGLPAADAEAHYAIDSITLRGKALAAEQRVANKAAAALQRAQIQAALAAFRSS